MADLYPPSYGRAHPSYHRHDSIQQQPQPQQQYGQMNSTIVYPAQVMSSTQSASSNSSDEHQDQPHAPQKSQDQPQAPPKPESKPQATFLTKLYALLERPENHHMIRWDPAGEHIIVERPEQLALHVLPSIYRQSRFASFSRQLNIYGFMRKVNLRNVDPAIDDPDASTWSHPTLNRHSPPEIVANFKRRVPPRLPKPRKRDIQEQTVIQQPRSAVGMGPVPLSVPSINKSVQNGRARGFSAPGSFTPLSNSGAAGWGTSYPRSALPPLTVPSDPPHISHSSMYNNSPHTLHPITPAAEDSPSSASFNSMSYSNSSRDMMVQSSQYPYSETQNGWQFSPVNSNGTGSTHAGGSLSSLLNPSSTAYNSRPTPTINTSYASNFSSVPMHAEHSASSLSPDSRPTTGYSMSSVSSMPPYDDANAHHMHDYPRPNSSHHRAPSPSSRPSSKTGYPPGTLSIRRARRHSQAMSPYPSPYEHVSEQHHHQRPSSSPQPLDEHQGSIPRVRSMIQLPSVDPYSFSSGHADFAYSAVPAAVGSTASIDSMDGGWGHGRSARPSTAASSISAASHSSSQATTPPAPDTYGNGEADINRFSPDFGFVPMNEHLPPAYSKAMDEH